MRISSSWSIHLLTYLLIPSLPVPIQRKIGNHCQYWCYDTETLHKHPWILSLRFRDNQIFCMSVSLLVGLLPYWNYTNMGISPVLEEIFSWFLALPLPFGQCMEISCPGRNIFLKFLETFLGCFYTISQWLHISCMSVNSLVGLLPYWS